MKFLARQLTHIPIFIASHAMLIHSSMIPNFYQTFQKCRLNLPSQFHLLLRNVYFD